VVPSGFAPEGSVLNSIFSVESETKLAFLEFVGTALGHTIVIQLFNGTRSTSVAAGIIQSKSVSYGTSQED